MISAAFSAIIIVGAFVFPDGTLRMTEASTTRRFSIPLTLSNSKKLQYSVYYKSTIRNLDLHMFNGQCTFKFSYINYFGLHSSLSRQKPLQL
jgi:hypothetical protein